MSRLRRRTVVVVGLLVAGACSSDASPPDGGDAVVSSPSTSTATTAVTTTTDPPEPTPAPTTAADTSTTSASSTPSTSRPDLDETLDSQLGWFLALLNGDDPTEADYERRFSESFRSQVPFDDFSALTPQVRAGADGWSVLEIEEQTDLAGTYLIAPAVGEPVIRLRLEVSTAGVIDTLFLQPAEPPTLDEPPASFDEAASRLSELGGSAVVVADVSAGECRTVDAVGDDAPVPIGSVIKLYVLGAVALAIEEGSLAWDDELVVTDELFSLPSGITQDEEPGTALTVQELATRMISISDNTATDMLIDAVGRRAVEEVQASMGHTDPDVNRPLLTTRELFIIKLDAELLDRYAAADPAARSDLLDEIADRPLPELSPGDFTEPQRPDEVEWFATPLDLCRALAYLHDRAQRTGLEPIRAIMTANPGVPNDELDEIWFKGGSEPGLLAVAWLLVDGERRYAVTGSVVDAQQVIDEAEAVLLFAAIRDLAAS